MRNSSNEVKTVTEAANCYDVKTCQLPHPKPKFAIHKSSRRNTMTRTNNKAEKSKSKYTDINAT